MKMLVVEGKEWKHCSMEWWRRKSTASQSKAKQIYSLAMLLWRCALLVLRNASVHCCAFALILGS